MNMVLFGSTWGSWDPSDPLVTAPGVGGAQGGRGHHHQIHQCLGKGIQVCSGISQSSYCRQCLKMTEKWELVAASPSTHLQGHRGVARKKKEDADSGEQAEKWDIPDYAGGIWRAQGGCTGVVSPSQWGENPKTSPTFSISHLLEMLPGLARPCYSRRAGKRDRAWQGSSCQHGNV